MINMQQKEALISGICASEVHWLIEGMDYRGNLWPLTQARDILTFPSVI